MNITPKLIEVVLDHLNLSYQWLDTNYAVVNRWLGGTIHIRIDNGIAEMEGKSIAGPINQLGFVYFFFGFLSGFQFLLGGNAWQTIAGIVLTTSAGFIQYFQEQVLRKTMLEIRSHLQNLAPETVLVD